MNNELPTLPVGTVLKLKNDEFQFMIMGFNYEDEDKIYDYVGVIAPIGIEPILKGVDKNVFFFNQEDIQEVYSLGYIDEKVNQVIKFNEALRVSRNNRK